MKKLSNIFVSVLILVVLFEAKSLFAQNATFQGLGDLGGGYFSSSASGVSADGSVVVGGSSEAFRWTQAGGMVGLGDLYGGGFESYANGVSADGSVVVGCSSLDFDAEDDLIDEAFIWDQTNGMQSLQGLLTDTYGLDLTDWHLSSANGISADGFTIVGYGINPDGYTEAWRATLPNPVPVPGAFLLGMIGLSVAGIKLRKFA